MPIINFPKNPSQEPFFFSDIKENGYHIYNLKSAKKPNYYPPELPKYPGVALKDLKKDDVITIRTFFGIGRGKNLRVESGYIDLQIEFVDKNSAIGSILTELPDQFALKTNESIEVFQEEILEKVEPE